jgi:polyhydroxybutyrate depolymerase
VGERLSPRPAVQRTETLLVRDAQVVLDGVPLIKAVSPKVATRVRAFAPGPIVAIVVYSLQFPCRRWPNAPLSVPGAGRRSRLMWSKRRRIIVAVLVIVIGLPVAFILAIVVWFALLGKTNGAIVSSGETRNYLLYVPKTYDRSKPTPLVISLHPAAVRPETEMEVSRWNELADEHGFIVVYPAGSDFPRVWPMGRTSLGLDVKFISDLIDRLEAGYNIDPRRIYADGMSIGGGMAFALACRLSDRIAAVGAVAAAQMLPWDWCRDSRPVPTIAFHGTADRAAPYAGGSSPIAPGTFPNIRDWTAWVARRNQCQGGPSETRITASVRRLAYTNCAEHADVTLYTVEGGGHSWPGGKPLPEWIVGRTTREINATRLIWEFYVQHPQGPR